MTNPQRSFQTGFQVCMSSEKLCVCVFVCLVFLEVAFPLALKMRQAVEGRTWQVPAQVEILSILVCRSSKQRPLLIYPNACQECVGFQTRAESPPAAGQCFEAVSENPHIWQSNPISVNSWAMESLGLPCWLGVHAAPQCVKAEKGWSHKVLWAPHTPWLSTDLVERNSIRGGLGECGCCSQAEQWPLAALFQLNKYYHVGFSDLSSFLCFPTCWGFLTVSL